MLDLECPLIYEALEYVRETGSPKSSDFANLILEGSQIPESYSHPSKVDSKTTSELLMSARNAIADGCTGSALDGLLSKIPICGDKYYYETIAALKSEGMHQIPDLAIDRIEKALEEDPGNEVYKTLAEMIDGVFAAQLKNKKAERSEARRLLNRLSSRIGQVWE